MAFRTLVVGLTGGIGAGKSAVSRCFEQLGVPVIDADVVAREVVSPGGPALAEIAAAFGSDVLDASGALDRARLRGRVFADPAERARLEAILHPRIRAVMQERVAALRGQSPCVVLVIPLLLEAGQRDMVDRVLVVEAPETDRIARVAARDGVPPDQVRRIIAAQLSQGQRMAQADDLIWNDGSESELRARVSALHQQYLEAPPEG
jgi:dephospho-CoA kinase